jgi:hypothetical protein
VFAPTFRNWLFDEFRFRLFLEAEEPCDMMLLLLPY